MNERIEKTKSQVKRAKKHIKENKKVYLASAASIGITTLVMRGRQGDLPKIIQKTIQIAFHAESSQTIVYLAENSTPSKPVHLVGTNLYFESLSAAARATGHHLSMISKQINGHIPDIKGDVFEILERA